MALLPCSNPGHWHCQPRPNSHAAQMSPQSSSNPRNPRSPLTGGETKLPPLCTYHPNRGLLLVGGGPSAIRHCIWLPSKPPPGPPLPRSMVVLPPPWKPPPLANRKPPGMKPPSSCMAQVPKHAAEHLLTVPVAFIKASRVQVYACSVPAAFSYCNGD